MIKATCTTESRLELLGMINSRPCYARRFPLQPATQRHCEASCRRNCACNTPSLQLATTQRKIAKQVARKVEQSSDFRNVAKPVAACNISSTTCFARYCRNYGAGGRKSHSKLSILTWARENPIIRKARWQITRRWDCLIYVLKEWPCLWWSGSSWTRHSYAKFPTSHRNP